MTSNGPIKLSASDITRGSSNISWCSQPNLVGYSDATIYRNYTLKVTEMNTNRTQLIKINDSMTYYVFQAGKNNEVCEVYNFSIIATYEIVGATYTGIDCNVPSTVLSRMLPSVPDTERLNSSLTYSLHLIHSNLKLNISFEVR